MMARLIKLVIFLVILSFIGLLGFAYLGDLSPAQTDVAEPVTLETN